MDTRIIMLSGVIGDDMAAFVTSAISHLVLDHKKEPINIIINSPGGIVINGFAIIDAIAWAQDSGVEVRGIVQGLAASMAALILQQCNIRVMSKRGYIMIHGPSGGNMGDLTSQRIGMAWAEDQTRQMIELLACRTRIPRDELERINQSDYWRVFSGTEAVQVGLVDHLVNEGPWKYTLPEPKSIRTEGGEDDPDWEEFKRWRRGRA